MRHCHLLAIFLTMLAPVACSNSSGLHNSGGTRSSAIVADAGPSTGAHGGSQASGGTSIASTPAISSGGQTSPSSSLGGHAGGMGGSSALTAGSLPKSGGSTAGGGTITGGSTRTASAGAAGGSNASTGGMTSSTGTFSGGTTSSGGSSSLAPDAGAGDGGIVASGFCEGNSPKLSTQGQTVTPAVTDYTSTIALDCCNGSGVNLHSTASLGFDVAIELILSVGLTTPGEYQVGGPSYRVRAAVDKSSDVVASPAGANAQGSLRVFGADASTGTPEVGLCLEVTNTASALSGTKIYVPKVKLGYYESNKRFQIFLLKDSTLRSDAVAALPLDSLVLADLPVLDLSRIAYVEKATTKIGFNPGQKIGESLRTKLGSTLGTPFVAVADGVRVYVGTFTSDMSSVSSVGPFVNVENIATDGFTLKAPTRGTDPRNDDRIIKALSERGKLVP